MYVWRHHTVTAECSTKLSTELAFPKHPFKGRFAAWISTAVARPCRQWMSILNIYYNFGIFQYDSISNIRGTLATLPDIFSSEGTWKHCEFNCLILNSVLTLLISYLWNFTEVTLQACLPNCGLFDVMPGFETVNSSYHEPPNRTASPLGQFAPSHKCKNSLIIRQSGMNCISLSTRQSRCEGF